MTAGPPPPLHGGGCPTCNGPVTGVDTVWGWREVDPAASGNWTSVVREPDHDQDYTENENREQVGQTWDYTPRSLSADNPDVAERYRLEWRGPGRWVYVHVGTLPRETA